MSNGVDEILLTFRQEEHILIVAKNVMILTLAKTKTPEVCYTSGVLSSITDIYYPFAYRHYSICKSENQYSSALYNSFLLRRNSILLQVFLQ